MPELPDEKRARFEDEHGLSRHDAEILTASRPLADFFEEAARNHGEAKKIANWILRDLLAYLKERDVEVDALEIAPAALAALVRLVDSGRLTAKSAREIFPELAERGGDPEEIMQARGLEAVQDTGLIEAAVDEVIAANPKSVATYLEGDRKVLNFMMGQVMKRTQGKANPAEIKKLLEKKLEG
jgi:aspartyl-tRNA(Asn)/glutamyl-tRNA(Gln) amidotransferase subunit B